MVTVRLKSDRKLGATVKAVTEPGELMALFDQANKRRHVAATKMNAESSRSHSIFSIIVERGDGKVGKLSLIDLAGSERVGKTGATGDQLKEGIEINKSLSALKSVILALTSGDKSIPYKESTLTLLLRDSLGGKSKTLMFVNFSPVDFNCAETIGALEYAEGVQKVPKDKLKFDDAVNAAQIWMRGLLSTRGGAGAAEGLSAASYPKRVAQAFKMFDRIGRGFVPAAELRYVVTSLGEERDRLSDEEVDAVFHGAAGRAYLSGGLKDARAAAMGLGWRC